MRPMWLAGLIVLGLWLQAAHGRLLFNALDRKPQSLNLGAPASGTGSGSSGSDSGSPADKPIDYSRPNPSVSSSLVLDQQSYAVTDLPGLAAGAFPTRHWAGHIPIPYAGNDHYGDAFFWLFEPQLDPKINPNLTLDNAPLIIWENGGPGCSSLEGLFIENGPFRVNDLANGGGLSDTSEHDNNDAYNQTLSIHRHSWHRLGWTVFVDQPLGTGLSRVNTQHCSWCDFVHNQSAVNSHMYSTLQSIVKIFPFLQNRSIYLTGESYAGHYLPSVADYILELNKHAANHDNAVLDVRGLALGNGWTDPEVQYNFGEFAHNMGLISSQEEEALNTQYKACLKQEQHGDYSGEKACNILNDILASSGVCPSRETAADDDFDDKTGKHKTSSGTCFGPIVNYYDIRSYYDDPGSDWPENSPRTEKYLSRADVQKAVHINHTFYPTFAFKECNHAGHNLMKLDGMGVVREVIRLLDVHKVPILFYNGQFDLICNHLGTETFLNGLEWKGQDDFVSAPGGIWAVANARGSLVPAGYSRASSDGLLTFLVVIGGSHMVPMDVPENSLDMIDRFIRRRGFIDGMQPYPRSSGVSNKKNDNKDNQWNDAQHQQQALRDTEQSSRSISSAMMTLLIVILSVGFTGALLVTLTVIRSYYWYRRDKYQPIRTINHIQGEDFTIDTNGVALMTMIDTRGHGNVGTAAVNGRYGSDDNAGSGSNSGNTSRSSAGRGAAGRGSNRAVVSPLTAEESVSSAAGDGYYHQRAASSHSRFKAIVP